MDRLVVEPPKAELCQQDVSTAEVVRRVLSLVLAAASVAVVVPQLPAAVEISHDDPSEAKVGEISRDVPSEANAVAPKAAVATSESHVDVGCVAVGEMQEQMSAHHGDDDRTQPLAECIPTTPPPTTTTSGSTLISAELEVFFVSKGLGSHAQKNRGSH
jgi:hypothetical protein